jgi:HPt (histidine-containing phosphotransfer) domain-containing protein
MNGSNDETIDAPYLSAVLGLDPERSNSDAGALVDLFLGDTAARLVDLRAAASRADRRATDELAHQLKGTAANFAAPRLARLCAEVEQAVAASDRVVVLEAIAAAEAEFQQVSTQLRQAVRANG